MERRGYLGGCACVAGTIAGCARLRSGDRGRGGRTAEEKGVSPSAASQLPVPRSQLHRGAPKDAIPAIDEPAFARDWSNVSYTIRGPDNKTYEAAGTLGDSDLVIGVSRQEDARAYPLRVLNWHEIVNDAFHGPLLVTYCPLCGSAVTAVRKADGEVTTFGVSGLLYRNDLVMYDMATESLWSQLEARAIRGELTGERLKLVPSSLTTWAAWRDSHPDTRVLLPPPKSGAIGNALARNYDLDPYAGYKSSRQIGIGGRYDDDRLHPKATVIGVAHKGASRAYPIGPVRDAGIVNDNVNGLPVVVAATEETLAAYVRRIDGDTLAFRRANATLIWAAGSRWRIVDGAAIDGRHEGNTLEQASDGSQMFFFAWKNFHPKTEVWSR